MSKLPQARVGLVDLHVYGGALLIAVGSGMYAVWAGPLTLGTVLLLLGIWRA